MLAARYLNPVASIRPEPVSLYESPPGEWSVPLDQSPSADIEIDEETTLAAPSPLAVLANETDAGTPSGLEGLGPTGLEDAAARMESDGAPHQQPDAPPGQRERPAGASTISVEATRPRPVADIQEGIERQPHAVAKRRAEDGPSPQAKPLLPAAPSARDTPRSETVEQAGIPRARQRTGPRAGRATAMAEPSPEESHSVQRRRSDERPSIEDDRLSEIQAPTALSAPEVTIPVYAGPAQRPRGPAAAGEGREVQAPDRRRLPARPPLIVQPQAIEADAPAESRRPLFSRPSSAPRSGPAADFGEPVRHTSRPLEWPRQPEAERTVEISIGEIDIRAPVPPPPVAKPAPGRALRPPMSLTDYLRRRSRQASR
jgi:hypothetical protein